MSSVKSEPAVENCYNCGRIIGRLETPMVIHPSANRWHIVCKECHQRLAPATPPAPEPFSYQTPPANPTAAAAISPERAAIEKRVALEAKAFRDEGERLPFGCAMALGAVIPLVLGGIIMDSLSSAGRHGVHNSGAEAFGIGFLTIGTFLLLGAFLSWIIRASTRKE